MNKYSIKLIVTLTLASVAVIIDSAPAKALNINFTYEPGVSWSYKRSAEFAALYWEDRISDDATVNIHLDVASSNKLPQGVLGGAIPAFENNVNYYNFKTALSNDRNSSDDYTAVSNLPNYGSDRWQGFIEEGWKLHDKINLTRANAKALGLISSHNSSLDGTILLSDLSNVNYSWEDKRTDYVNSNEFDLTSVLIHEIGHIMGFVSAVDSVNTGNIGSLEDRYNYMTSLNLFSRSAWSANENGLDVSYGQESFFSINDGQTNLGNFSTGEDTNLGNFGKGDGWQASHWKSTINAMMNPFLYNGQQRELTDLDLTAFDVIGWNRDSVNYSDSTLTSQADNNANNIGNTYKASAIDKMLTQRGWGGNSTSTTYRQDMELADYLYQEGFFQKGSAGALWSTFEPATASTSVPEPVSILSLLGLGLLGISCTKKKDFS